jgi:hypothetical protein
MAWPDEPPADASVAALVPPPPVAPAASVVVKPAAAMSAASATDRASDCAAGPPLSAHEQALAVQRAMAQLASGSGGDAVLALLMHKPQVPDAAWAEQVRQAALRSQDAQALRWAAGACATSACRRELLQERLRLEPDNALHWLAWLDEDPTAQEAWQGLAAARYWREQPQALDQRVARALPPGLLPAQREALLQPWRAQAWAASAPPSSTLANACGHYGATHPVGVACAHAAELMLAHGDSPAGWQQGAELARQLGRREIPPQPSQPAATACR